jgi:hypothetical protein
VPILVKSGSREIIAAQVDLSDTIATLLAEWDDDHGVRLGTAG